MPGVIPYKVSLDIDNQQALKKLLDVNTKMTQLENGQILIDFKYNKNIKDFNKKAAEISKLSPDLGVQFQYDVNKRGLLQAKEQLTQLTDLQVGVDTLGAKEYIKQLTKEVKDLFDDAASEQQLAAPIQKLLNTVITLDKDLLPSIQVELGDIYEEFEELSKLKPISLMNMGDIDDLEHDIKGFESALEKLKKQGAIDVADKADNKEIAELTERVSILEDRVLSLQHGLLSLSGEGFINASDSADVLLSKLVEIAKTLEIIPQKTYDVSKAVVHNGNISVIGKKERVRSDNMGRLPELLMNGMGHGSDFFFSTPPAADVASDTFGGLTNGFKGLKTYIIDLSKLKDELHQLQFEEQAAEDEAIEALKSINAFAFKESAGIDKLKELGIETKDTSRYGYEIPDTIEDLYNIVKDKIPDMSLTLKEFNNLLQEEIQKLNSMGEITQKGFYENQEKFGNEILPSDKLLEKLGYTGFTPISDGPNDGSGIGGWIINVEKYLHNTEDSIEYIKSFTEKQADEAEDYIANIDQHFAELNNQLKEKFKEYIVQVIQLAKTLGESIANGLADGIDAHSDSKKAIKSGEDFVNGVTHSIEDNTDEAVSAAKQLGEKVSDALDESLNNINDDTVSLSISSPTQVFDNEIQQNLVMLENYKNTIAEIDRLKLEPETDEIKHKIEELNKLADYFASKITTIQSENGHEVNRSMMQFMGTWNENLRNHYTEDQRKEFWKIAGERSGLNRRAVATEFSGITEELERIEEKSNKLASIYAKDITESRNYVSRLRADLLNLVETQEELAITSPKSKDYALYAKDIDVFSKRSPELLQFLDKLKTYEQATDFVKTDEWLDFLATLPKAHVYLESIGYDFEKIAKKADENNLSSDIENEIDKAKIELEELRREYQALYEVVNSPNGPSKMTKEEVRRYFDLEEIIEEAEGKVKRLQSHLSDGKDNQNEFNLELKDGVEIQDTLGRVIDSNNAKILEGTKLISSQNGQLRVLYHGSNSSDFEKFDVNRIGENGSKFGRGAYFAFKKSDAQTYGHNVSEWFANITKIYNDNAQFSEEELTQIFNEYKNDIEDLWGSIDLDKFLNKIFGKTAYDQIDLLANDITGLSEDDLLKKLGYQGRYLQLEEGNGLVVFDLDNIVKARNVLSEIQKQSNETPDLFEGKSGQLSFIENLTEAEEKASTAAEELVDDLSRVKDQIDGQMNFDDLQTNAQIDYSVQSEEKLLPMVIDSTDAIEKRNEEMRRMQAIQQAFMNDIGQSNEAKINRDITETLEQRRKEQEKLNEAKQEEVSTSLSSPTVEVDINAEESAKAAKKEAEVMSEIKEESEKASTSKRGFAKANAEVLQSIKESLTGLGSEADLFKALNNTINKLSGKGSDERITTLSNNLIRIREALSGSIDENGFISALQKLSEQGDNLKDLASILKASKKQIESVKDSIDDADEMSQEDRDALVYQLSQSEEYEREQKRILAIEKEIEKARKEGQKQAEAYAKQQLDEQNKLTSSIENYSKKLQDAINADKIAKQTGAGVSRDLVNRWETLKADLGNIDVTADTTKAQEEFVNLKEKIDSALSPKERKFEKVIPEEVITNLGAQIEDFGAKNTRLSKELSERLEEVRRRYQALLNSGSTGDALERELKSISSELNKIKTEANAAGQAGKNFGHMMLDSLKSANARFIANYLSIQDMIRYVRELANTVREVDSAITELRKVSDASATRLQQNFEQSAKTAKELGSSITDVINQTADWARLGYNVDEAEKLARVTTLFQTVGDNMTAETASEAMISTLKAYGISVDESERIVDQYNEIANNFAIDTAGLADSITRAGAALHAGGNALSESMGLVVAANDSLQDPSSVGQMLKTMSMRLRGASVADLEELGIDTTGMSQGTKSIVQQFKAMAGIDIMEGTNYKSTFQILDELHDKWADLTDAEHAALTEAVGGKRGGSVMSSLMENWDDAKAVVEKAEQSTGSAMKEQLNYAQSIQFSLDRLNASWQELQVDLLDSSAVKNIVDLGNQLVNIIDELISNKTALAGVLSLIAGGIATKKNVGGLKNTSPTLLSYSIV